MTAAELDRDHPAKAMADDDRPLDSNLHTERRHVVGEFRDRLAVARDVTLADPAQINRSDGVLAGEMVELWPERGVVAAPAGQEEQFGLAAPSTVVVQPDPLNLRVRHD
jgi:hypothetical protein